MSKTSEPKGRPTTSKKQRRAEGRAMARRQTLFRYAVIGVGAAIVIGVGVFATLSGDTASGETDVEAWDLPAIRGDENIALADFDGTPVVLNFFASWCTSCDFELPHFRAVSEALRDEVTFVGVNAQETGDRMLMPERHDITWWPLVRDVGGSDNNSGLHANLGGRGMPITAFYDAEGNLVDVALGTLDQASLVQRIEGNFGIEVGEV